MNPQVHLDTNSRSQLITPPRTKQDGQKNSGVLV